MKLFSKEFYDLPFKEQVRMLRRALLADFTGTTKMPEFMIWARNVHQLLNDDKYYDVCNEVAQEERVNEDHQRQVK
jgi:hypothetical protein